VKITFTIPDIFFTELEDIAKVNGFDNLKQMTAAYFKASLEASRVNKAVKEAREKTEFAIKTELSAIT